MLALIHEWLGWPNGAVLTNLVASAITVGFGVWRVLKSHAKLHAKIDRVHKHLGLDEES